jgi:hypothetical protein
MKKELNEKSKFFDIESKKFYHYERQYEEIHQLYGGKFYHRTPSGLNINGFIEKFDSLIFVGNANRYGGKQTPEKYTVNNKLLFLYHIEDTPYVVISDGSNVLVTGKADFFAMLENFDGFVKTQTKEYDLTYYDAGLSVSKEFAEKHIKFNSMVLPYDMNPKRFIDLRVPRVNNLYYLSKSYFPDYNLDVFAKAFKLNMLYASQDKKLYYFEKNNLGYTSDVHSREDIMNGSLGFKVLEYQDIHVFYRTRENMVLGKIWNIVAIDEKNYFFHRTGINHFSWFKHQDDCLKALAIRVKNKRRFAILQRGYMERIVDNFEEFVRCAGYDINDKVPQNEIICFDFKEYGSSYIHSTTTWEDFRKFLGTFDIQDLMNHENFRLTFTWLLVQTRRASVGYSEFFVKNKIRFNWMMELIIEKKLEINVEDDILLDHMNNF